MDSQEPENPELDALSVAESCSQGHTSVLSLPTQQGGIICLLCLSNLITTPLSPTLHVSYALSQLSLSLPLSPSHRTHAHFLCSPLIHALSSFDDQPIACQIISVITTLCASNGADIFAEFVSGIADKLSSGALAWSRRQLYMLHCFGVLLNSQTSNSYVLIKDKDALTSNLVAGLHSPCEEIRGEILFVLYKVSILQAKSINSDGADVLFPHCPKLLHLSLEALMKTQNDDVRLNCLALLTILAQKGFFVHPYANDLCSMSLDEANNFMEITEDGEDCPSLNVLFAEAIKGPLLSSDNEVQISSLDLIFHILSSEGTPGKLIQVLVEQNIADYVFEILRLSECKDPTVNSCLQVLNLLSTAEQAFKQRLVVGFTALIPVLHHVAEVPFHPYQNQTLKLIWSCISDCPGILSISLAEELLLCLTMMLKRNNDGEMSMPTETFIMTCSIFVAILKSPSSSRISNLATSIQEVPKYAVLVCISTFGKDPSQLLHSLYLLKELYAYSYEEFSTSNSNNLELRNSIISLCTSHLLPWFVKAIHEINEETVLGVLETFHFIMIKDCDMPATEFARMLVSYSWFSLSYGCLGLFPSEKLKWRVHLMVSSIVDILLGSDTGQYIRDAACYIPSDPADMLFLLGQKSADNLELSSCQSAVLLILHVCSLYNDRLADETSVLASLEQYILVNRRNFECGAADLSTMMWLVNLYGFFRNFANKSYRISYSPEAERILFYLVTENEWDLPAAVIHSSSLRWLFQQEKLSKPLSYQILKLCRSHGTDVVVHGSQTINEKMIAELVAAEDNYAAAILVSLLIELVEQEGHEHDIVVIVNFMEKAINAFPATSDQLCLHGMGNAIRALYYKSNHYSLQTFMAISFVTFNILCSVHPEVLSDNEDWVAVTIKLIDYLVCTVAVHGWTDDSLIITGILSLILHHATNNALVEASKTIVLNTSLVSTINGTIDTACSKGPSVIDHDEGANTGESLIFVLLLYYSYLRSLHAALPDHVEWQNFVDPLNSKESLTAVRINYPDLCRLMHFGSCSVKLVSSYCLLELFNRLSDQESREHEEPNCSIGFLTSMLAVLEGLVFYSDMRVAMNCGLCLSMVLGWKKLDLHHSRIIAKNFWLRLIVEEMALSLAVPCLSSKSFFNHHKPAVHVAVALLKLDEIPLWLRTVFDDYCISGIIGNLEASHVSSEIVLLFRQLFNSNFLKAEQIASLNYVLQACRKYIYSNSIQDNSWDEHAEKNFTTLDNLRQVREYLIHSMSSQLSVKSQNGDSRLLEELETFFRSQ